MSQARAGDIPHEKTWRQQCREKDVVACDPSRNDPQDNRDQETRGEEQRKAGADGWTLGVLEQQRGRWSAHRSNHPHDSGDDTGAEVGTRVPRHRQTGPKDANRYEHGNRDADVETSLRCDPKQGETNDGARYAARQHPRNPARIDVRAFPPRHRDGKRHS